MLLEKLLKTQRKQRIEKNRELPFQRENNIPINDSLLFSKSLDSLRF
jgi:hypothetical protein